MIKYYAWEVRVLLYELMSGEATPREHQEPWEVKAGCRPGIGQGLLWRTLALSPICLQRLKGIVQRSKLSFKSFLQSLERVKKIFEAFTSADHRPDTPPV
jgi:hypothetical protein